MNSANIEKKIPSWATRKELTTPVLYMVFNRPEITQESFNAIREAKPKKLYVAVDAPRVNRKDDEENQAKVIQIVKNVDWDCNVKYLIHEKNLGCSRAGIAAWNWLFSQEDRMIFVEDDGVPSVSFFYYCQELLEDYKDNDKIAYIGGVNYGMKRGEASYFFTRQCAATYAMGTWKRVYDLYEYDMASYPEYRNKKSFKEAFSNKKSYYGHLLMFGEIETDAEITKEDISVQWQTLSGETTDSQKNQFGLAVVTVSAEGAVIDQRVISFVGGAVERIADAVNPQ